MDLNNQEYQQFIEKQIDQLNKQHNIDLSEYKYIFEDQIPKKQTDAKYEIYINLTANILSNKSDDELLAESVGLVTNNYYIPVPSGQDYTLYTQAFFEKLQQCMEQSASIKKNNE